MDAKQRRREKALKIKKKFEENDISRKGFVTGIVTLAILCLKRDSH